jgi:hypothetical protein
VFLSSTPIGRSTQQAAGSEVRGVSAVTDHLTVTYPKTRPDAEIQQDVETTLSNDVDLIGLPMRVTVTKGWVTLDGTVGSAYQKQRAGTSAHLIWNVTGVDNQLMVNPAMDRGTRRQAGKLTDARAAAAVRTVPRADAALQDDVALQRHIERRLIANSETNWVAKAIRTAVD